MDLVERLRAAAAASKSLRLGVLFGSAARGDASAASDIDIGVLVTQDAEALDDVARALRSVAGDRLDLTDISVAPPLLRFEIARDGVLLHEVAPGTWTEFRAHAMIDWWDWAPTARMIHRAAAARLRSQTHDQP